MIDANRHRLSVSLPAEPIYLDADPVRLAQVFANLLNNAAKYTEDGGRVWIEARRTGDGVTVIVRDSGIGISPAMLPHIFEIFSQAEPALERSQGGLGIGLSLVKGIVELHGGTIEAHSHGAGEGSEFVVCLPVSETAAPGQPAAPGPEVETPATGMRILVVDDNRDNADTLAMILKVMGNEVETAFDGQQALQVARAWRPEVVLLDVGMPKLNGYDACRSIRAEPWGEAMYLVALTGWGKGGGSPAHRGGRLRPPPRQAGGPRCAPTAALHRAPLSAAGRSRWRRAARGRWPRAAGHRVTGRHGHERALARERP